MKHICVVGYYNNGNIGDEAFKIAIPRVLGERHFYTFLNRIPDNINEAYDRLVIGGGSFLDQEIPGPHNVSIPVVFLGVGLHGGVIHPSNRALYEGALFRLVRNSSSTYTPLKGEYDYGADLVFARADELRSYISTPANLSLSDNEKHVLVILNGFLIPTVKSAPYKRKAFGEFQTLLTQIDSHYGSVEYIAMQTQGIDDRWMRPDLEIPEANEVALCEAIDRADLVITTRFHGCIFSTILETPFVAVAAHDKMFAYINDLGWLNSFNYYSENHLFAVLGAANLCVSPESLRDATTRYMDYWKDRSPLLRSLAGL